MSLVVTVHSHSGGPLRTLACVVGFHAVRLEKVEGLPALPYCPFCGAAQDPRWDWLGSEHVGPDSLSTYALVVFS